ncbi:MAG: CoA ester lyase [Rhodospirillaceae bacterium]|nr:CoA ester lyase [Rhodospirillaceae bacterium]
MPASEMPRRSALYMPASNARALEKAKTLAADVLIFDLEDAVAPEAKAAARDAAVAAVKGGGYGPREILIRANGRDTPWCAVDLAAIASSGAHGAVLPKVSGADDIARAENLLAAAPATLALWAMIETPRGVLNAAEIAGAGTRLAGLIVGTADLAKDLRCAHPADRWPMLQALQMCVLAARANGLAVLDGVHLDIADMGGFDAACRQGRDLGFDGKTLIHPSQIAGANAAFSPGADELERAKRIMAAHAEAAAQGKGVTLLDGRLVEALHVKEAQRLLARAEMIALRG